MSGREDDEPMLEDHPPYRGPKRGDREVNAERDAQHYAQGHPGYVRPALDQSKPKAEVMTQVFDKQSTMPADAPPVVAWKQFMSSGGYEKAISQFDLFLAGWTARDSQP